MQATGLKTAQPAFNRDLLGILFGAVVLAAIVAALIIVTSSGVGAKGSAVAPDTLTNARAQYLAGEQADRNAMALSADQARSQFQASERADAAAAAAASKGSVRWIQPDGFGEAPGATVSTPKHVPAN